MVFLSIPVSSKFSSTEAMLKPDLPLVSFVILLLQLQGHPTVAVRVLCNDTFEPPECTVSFYDINRPGTRTYVTSNGTNSELLQLGTLLNTLAGRFPVVVVSFSAFGKIQLPANLSLTRLRLDHVRYAELQIERNEHLQDFIISHNALDSVPSTLGNLVALHGLTIANTQLQIFSLNSLNEMSELKMLTLSSNKLHTIVAGRDNVCCPKLTLLEVSHNHITHLDGALLSPMVAIERMYLGYNHIATISGSWHHPKLSDVILHFNWMRNFSLCEWDVPSLTTLFLDANDLTNFPSCVEQKGNLQGLYMAHNRLSVLNFSELAALDRLAWMDLSANGIKDVVAVDGRVPGALSQLTLNVNNISSIDVDPFPHLQNLNLANNSFATLGMNRSWAQPLIVTVENNPMSCSWLQEAQSQLTQQNVTLTTPGKCWSWGDRFRSDQ